MSIYIKKINEQNKMRIAGKKLAKVLYNLKKQIKEGMTTKDLDSIAYDLIIKEKSKPAFLNYNGYPATICTSINNEVVHGIPSDKKILLDGDILSIDIGLYYNDYCSDMAITIPIGKISDLNKKLIDVTRESLYKGIEIAKIGNTLGDIGFAIQNYVEKNNFSVVLEYTGHGIGKRMHEEPDVLNYGIRHTGTILKEGMILAIEPMVNIGTWQTKVLNDNWTVITKDSKNSAHFEHTILITKNEAEILTQYEEL